MYIHLFWCPFEKDIKINGNEKNTIKQCKNKITLTFKNSV